MKVIKEAEPVEWSYEWTCKLDDTVLAIEPSDLEADRVKPPGTFWFDGSAERAGLSWGYYTKGVQCPRCKTVPGRIKDKHIPEVIQLDLQRAYIEENPKWK